MQFPKRPKIFLCNVDVTTERSFGKRFFFFLIDKNYLFLDTILKGHFSVTCSWRPDVDTGCFHHCSTTCLLRQGLSLAVTHPLGKAD